ncbi:MAG: N-acetylmuramoyl-L-alanine amidase [Myxococcaceae bacterium]
MKTQAAAIALAALLAGCAQAPTEPAPGYETRGTSSLEAAFEDAAAEYQVPVSVLKGIAFVETRVNPTVERSAAGGRGLMQLVRREDWDTLSRAKALTGADETRLESDPAANIRGAAAVLRELADRSFAQYTELDSRNPGDFFHAVSLYAGLSSASMGAEYASQVFGTIESGFSVQREDGTVVQAPTLTGWQRHAPAGVRHDGLKQYPAAYQWLASPNYSSGRTNYTWVLIHTTQGSYAGTLSWFRNTSSNVSSHYVVRSSDGQVTQMVENQNTAWHAQCYNGKSIGIEHEGFVSAPDTWYTTAMYTESAKLTRWLCDRHGIPRDRSHIIGHNEVAPSCNTGGHYDPGSGWNWTRYMSLVNGTTSTPTTGKLTGAIYTGGSTTNRVAGAVVTVGSQSKTTGTDGIYEFVLNPGSYTATVTKAGFGSNSVTRAVTASATVWGSMEINAVTSTGTLKGKVFIYNSANPTDMSQAITGATVTAGGKTTTSDATGFYTFTLAPGTYTVSATKTGYAANSLSRAVTSGAVTWGSVGLTSNVSPDVQPPQLAITFPADNATLDLAELTLTGTASDDRGQLTQLSLKVNGGTPATVAVSGGAFSQQIKLSPGANTLEVSAVDPAGNSATVTSKATFNSGVSGFVHLVDDEATRVPDITVELRDGTGAVVASAVSSAAGAYSLDLTDVPSDYVLVAKGAGFITHSETVSVPDDARLTLNVAMTAGSEVLPGDMSVSFLEPLDGSTVSSATVAVRGSVVGMDVAAVTLNGFPADVGTEGMFSALVALNEGSNAIEALATGTKGETATAHVTVIRKTAMGDPGQVDPAKPAGGCGCTSFPGAGLFGLLLAAPLLRRRRK